MKQQKNKFHSNDWQRIFHFQRDVWKSWQQILWVKNAWKHVWFMGLRQQTLLLKGANSSGKASTNSISCCFYQHLVLHDCIDFFTEFKFISWEANFTTPFYSTFEPKSPIHTFFPQACLQYTIFIGKQEYFTWNSQESFG